jgi:hypothetical protein
MCSSADRNRLILLLILPALAAGGCAGRQPAQQTRPPMIVDEAMQRRDWERSVSYYPNGDTVSGHNRFPLRTDLQPGTNEYGAAAYDIAASLVQTVALPFTYVFVPPFSRAVYHGDDVGPSYTAMPEMRPPAATVNVDGLVVDRDTLQVRGRPQKEQSERYRRHGPQGPGDSDFMSSDPSPVDSPRPEEFE